MPDPQLSYEDIQAQALRAAIMKEIRAQVQSEVAESFKQVIATLKADNASLRGMLNEVLSRPTPELVARFAAGDMRPVVNVTIPEGAIRLVCEHGPISVPKDAIKVQVESKVDVKMPDKKRTPVNVEFTHDKDGRIVGMKG